MARIEGNFLFNASLKTFSSKIHKDKNGKQSGDVGLKCFLRLKYARPNTDGDKWKWKSIAKRGKKNIRKKKKLMKS